MVPCNFQFHLSNWSTLNQKCMMIFKSTVRTYGKLSAKHLSGTSTVIEKVGPLSYFLFYARITIRIRLNSFLLE